MLTTPGGQERTEAEYAELFSKAGLRLTRVVPDEGGDCADADDCADAGDCATLNPSRTSRMIHAAMFSVVGISFPSANSGTSSTRFR